MVISGPTKIEDAKIVILDYLKQNDWCETRMIRKSIVGSICSQRILYDAINELIEEGIVVKPKRGHIALTKNESKYPKEYRRKVALEKLAIDQGTTIIKQIFDFKLNPHKYVDPSQCKGMKPYSDHLLDYENNLKSVCHLFFYIIVQIEKNRGVKFRRQWDDSECDPPFHFVASISSKHNPELGVWITFFTNVIEEIS